MSHFFICALAFGAFFFSWAETSSQWGAAPKGEEVLHEKVHKEVSAPIPYKSWRENNENSEGFGFDSLDGSDVEALEKESDQEDQLEDDFLKDLDEELVNDPDISGDEEADAPEESEDASELDDLNALDEDLAQDPAVEADEGHEEESESESEGDAS